VHAQKAWLLKWHDYISFMLILVAQLFLIHIVTLLFIYVEYWIEHHNDGAVKIKYWMHDSPIAAHELEYGRHVG